MSVKKKKMLHGLLTFPRLKFENRFAVSVLNLEPESSFFSPVGHVLLRLVNLCIRLRKLHSGISRPST